MVITGETDQEARAKWTLYKSGADFEALRRLTAQSEADTKSGSDTNVRHMADETSAVNLNIGLVVGSHATCARLLDEVATIPGLAARARSCGRPERRRRCRAPSSPKPTRLM